MSRFEQPPQESSQRSVDFKLTALLAMALTFSACFEKAKTWSGEQLKAFSERNPKVERLDTYKAETIISTISDLKESVKRGGSKTIDMRDEELAKQYAADPSLKDHPYVYEATLVDDNTVLVEAENPLAEKINDKTGEITMFDTVYNVAKDPKTGRVAIMIKQGNLLNNEGQRPSRETAIDRDTGVVEYVTHDGTADDRYGFSLEDDGKGNLRVRAGSMYEEGLGQKLGERGDEQMRDVAKKLAAAVIADHESRGQ
ncbi:MAG TPA: hypothetical protein VN380_18190 [Thermoanaerobaculia bacterium]|jgi:hypothetical protein|nr:hypothetical protein [Thermoanaerobaculia bacterium]